MFSTSGPAAGSKIVFTSTGNCQGSDVDQRPDAYRCFLDHNEPNGGNIADPCFSGPGFDYLLCPSDAAGKTLVRVNAAVTPVNTGSFNPAAVDPWQIELTDGQDCVLESGATTTVAGMRANYSCDNGGWLYGSADRAGTVWTIFYAAPNSTSLTQVEIARAIS